MLLSKFNNDAQRSRILDGRILAFRQAYTKVGFYFIIEDNICRLIINVMPEVKLNKDLPAGRQVCGQGFNVLPCYCKYLQFYFVTYITVNGMSSYLFFNE